MVGLVSILSFNFVDLVNKTSDISLLYNFNQLNGYKIPIYLSLKSKIQEYIL